MYRFCNLTAAQHEALQQHLFPGDGKEAVAVALCGRCANVPGFQGIILHEILLIPHERCQRESGYIHWPMEMAFPLIKKAMQRGMAVAKIHCHPGGESYFSGIDTHSDTELFNSLFGWSNGEGFHASLIMLPDGRLFGRIAEPVPDGVTFQFIDRIRVIGDEITIWDNGYKLENQTEFTLRTRQAFGKGTTSLLRELRLAVIGCSGTGSPTIEQLVRLGVGEIHLIDPDTVETKNLNRILNSRAEDIGKHKVEILKVAIEKMGLGTRVFTYPVNIYDDPAVIRVLGTMDVLVGCTDSVDSRHLLNQISTFYTIPYLDIGVKLLADGQGGIDKICGSLHYLLPGQALLDRGIYDGEDLRAASLFRSDPARYREERQSGYIKNIEVESPAVISVNMVASSLAVLELLARLHPYRIMRNHHFAHTALDVTDWYVSHESKTTQNTLLEASIGRGDMQPMLNMPELSLGNFSPEKRVFQAD